VDVHFVAATNASLDQLLRSGSFRSDLYYRLAVFLIDLPPLRERREDIPLLVEYFLIKHALPGRLPLRLSADANAVLASWH
jgi:transcriptional regulator with GAF, ATPase, and Fis domain